MMFKKNVCVLLALFLLFVVPVQSSNPAYPEKNDLRPASGLSSGKWVVWSGKPAIRWEDAFVTGNGRHGTMPTGKPGHERIICVHEELFIRSWDRNKVAVANIAYLLPRVRALIDSGRYDAASALAGNETRRQLAAMGVTNPWPLSPHPAFDINMLIDTVGTTGDYRRQLDMETGEVLTRWKDRAGSIEERIFSSRIHDVNVLQLKAGNGKKLNLSLSLDETPGRKTGKGLMNVDDAIRNEVTDAELAGKQSAWLSFHVQYAKDSGGYDGIARVIVKGGQIQKNQNKLVIKDAAEVLLLIRIKPLDEGSRTEASAIKNELATLPADYEKLHRPHALQHSNMFLRSALDLGAASQWKTTSTDDMLDYIHSKGISPLFLEQIYAMGRYLLISSSGKYPPPLQGIWGGGWNPAWLGGFVFDSNVNLAISAISTGDLSECAQSYFDYVKNVLPGWRLNAKNYLGTRGFMVAHYADPEKGYLNHYLNEYPWMYWPGGAGWNFMPFYEHALLNGDTVFMRKEVLPLYREMADFYEDYLVKGSDGYFHIYPGISPENSTRGSHTLISKDATMDVAIAKEVFEHLLKMGKILNLPKQETDKWKSFYNKMVPYRINQDGALAEWVPVDSPDNYAHRHNSHLYPVFPGTEFLQPGVSPDLLKATKVALDKRFTYDTESAHGLIHVALMACRLQDTVKVKTNLDRFARRNYFYKGLVTSHNPEHNIFNLDGVLSFQRLMYEMMVFSQPERITLLPACPADFPDGTLKGVRIHGGHKVDITWLRGKLGSATIYAGKEEDCEIRYGNLSNKVSLKSGKVYSCNDQLNIVNIR